LGLSTSLPQTPPGPSPSAFITPSFFASSIRELISMVVVLPVELARAAASAFAFLSALAAASLALFSAIP